MSFSPVRTLKTITGGAGDMVLKDRARPTKTLLTFHGSVLGNVTVTAKVQSGTRFNAVTDGAIDLASRDYVFIPEIPLDTVHIVYDGVGSLDVVAVQYPTA